MAYLCVAQSDDSIIFSLSFSHFDAMDRRVGFGCIFSVRVPHSEIRKLCVLEQRRHVDICQFLLHYNGFVVAQLLCLDPLNMLHKADQVTLPEVFRSCS